MRPMAITSHLVQSKHRLLPGRISVSSLEMDLAIAGPTDPVAF